MGAGSRVDPAPLVSIAGLPLLERIEAEADAATIATEARLRLPFEARSRSRQRARLTDGTEVALVLPVQASPVLTRELLYTGVTRSRGRITLIASEAALRGAIEHRIERSSGLRARVRTA